MATTNTNPVPPKQNAFQGIDEFDLALALYHWLQHNWNGQGDPLYRDFCTLTTPGMFKPGGSEEIFENVSDDVRAIYNILDHDNYKEALERVLNYEPQD